MIPCLRLPLQSAVLILVCLCQVSMAGEAPKLKPQDEASKDPSFYIFRARLMQAVAEHDVARLLSVVDPMVSNGFGGNEGIAEFRKTWTLGTKESKVWKVLGDVLSLGGKFEDGGKVFSAPYVSACFPEDLDGFEHAAVVGENIRLRSAAKADAEVVGSLSWDIVKVAPDTEEEAAWVKVTTASGKTGYVAREFIRSPLAMRASFENRGGKWLLMSLLSGD